MDKIKVTSVKVLPGDSGFLIDTGKTAILYDSGFAFTGEGLTKNIERELGGRNLDFIFLTHSHYDHAPGAMYAARRWKNAKVVAGEYAAKIFAKPSARATMKELDAAFARENGIYEYENLIDNLHVDITVNDGDKIRAGELEFEVIYLPGHTKCSVGYYCREKKFLLGTESLGVPGPGDIVIPSYLVGYNMVIESIKRVKELTPSHILLPHSGVIHGDECGRFLKNAMENAVGLAKLILEGYKNGKSDEELVNIIRDRYYKGYIAEIYPIKAFELNSSITVSLIKKELGKQVG